MKIMKMSNEIMKYGVIKNGVINVNVKCGVINNENVSNKRMA
jgi:hypothetical protein